MDVQLSAELLEEVTSEVLGETAFIFVEALDNEPDWDEGELLETRLTFSGDAQGELLFACNPALGIEFAANLLGLEPGEDQEIEAQSGDAIGEVLNIIAGPLLSAWLGDQAVCDIGPPSGAVVAPETHRERLAGATCSLAMETEEGLPLELAVFAA